MDSSIESLSGRWAYGGEAQLSIQYDCVSHASLVEATTCCQNLQLFPSQQCWVHIRWFIWSAVDLLEMRSALGRWSRLASIGAGMREWKQCSPSNDVLALTCVWAMLGVLYSLDTIAVGTSDWWPWDPPQARGLARVMWCQRESKRLGSIYYA
jgi:hypothetical protein